MNPTTANAESINDLKLGEHYTIFKDGYGAEHKIAIHSHPLFCKRNEGEVTLKAFRVDMNHNTEEHRPDIETKTVFKCVKDRLTGLWFGEPIGIDQADKQIKWKKFPLRMINVYNLSIPEQRHAWAMISRSNIVEGSPNQGGRPLYKVIDSEAKNIDFMQTIVIRDSAAQVLKGMSGNQLVDFAPSIGIHPGSYSHDALRTEFFRYIEKNSKQFMEVWDNPARETVVQFRKALQLGVIVKKSNQGHFLGYYYENYPLGISESESIAWLNQIKNSAVLSSMVIQTQMKENSIHRGNTKENVVVKVDAEKEEMAKKIAELEERLSATQIKQPIVHNATPIQVSNQAEEPKTEQLETLESLKEEAQKLKIPGFALAKDPIKLKAKIEEAKSKLQTV